MRLTTRSTNPGLTTRKTDEVVQELTFFLGSTDPDPLKPIEVQG